MADAVALAIVLLGVLMALGLATRNLELNDWGE